MITIDLSDDRENVLSNRHAKVYPLPMASKIPEQDIRLLALFVHRGRLSKEDAKEAMTRAMETGASVENVLLSMDLIREGEWEEWKRAGGETPGLKGYEIVKRLGEGGSSIVYLAREVAKSRLVALKVARNDPSLDKESFVREGKLLCALSHPSIVKAFKLARQKETIYLVMEYLEGETALERLLRGERFGEEEALNTALSIAKGLHYLEENGIVHRDVKPGNIMLLQRGEAKLIDLGLAVEKGASGRENVAGTAHYMAPEQAEGGEVDQRADIYSLGVTIFHIVTGELPFEGSD